MITFDTAPDRYKHWQLTFDGPVATLSMDVREDAGLSQDYKLKLNSYDLAVDIELADAIQRLRFEHPEVHAVIITSLKERIFCAGANIMMLRGSSHGAKVDFCKFTNETRLAIESASEHSGIKFLAALNGICAGGGYELALACDEIVLVDDGNSAVSLPETPLLGVLPGTGGLTRVVDKRKVRRDLADFFSTVAEGVKGGRAVEWRLVDQVVPKSKFEQVVADRAKALAAKSDRPKGERGLPLQPIQPAGDGATFTYRFLTMKLNPQLRTAELWLKAPDAAAPASPAQLLEQGSDAWVVRAFRELDDALLRLRMNHLDIGTVVLRTQGDPARVLEHDRFVAAHQDHWLGRGGLGLQKSGVKRLDPPSKTLFAFVEPGSCFAGSLLELVLAADRSSMLDDAKRPTALQLGPLNDGL